MRAGRSVVSIFYMLKTNAWERFQWHFVNERPLTSAQHGCVLNWSHLTNLTMPKREAADRKDQRKGIGAYYLNLGRVFECDPLPLDHKLPTSDMTELVRRWKCGFPVSAALQFRWIASNPDQMSPTEYLDALCLDIICPFCLNLTCGRKWITPLRIRRQCSPRKYISGFRKGEKTVGLIGSTTRSWRCYV